MSFESPRATFEQPMASSFFTGSKRVIRSGMKVYWGSGVPINMVGPAAYTGHKICIPVGKDVDLKCRIKVSPLRKTNTTLIEGQLPEDILVAQVEM